MRVAVVSCFLNEQPYIDKFLRSIATQERPPDRLLLVDDGSTDASPEIAAEFVRGHDYARLLRRPPRPPERDRLAGAAELVAFCWGVEQLDVEWDTVVKLDVDLDLPPGCFTHLVRALEEDPGLGIVGPYLSVVDPRGERVREPGPPDHVRGPAKFYRRECFRDVFPLQVRLGWDTSDEVAARMRGWRTASVALPGGDPIHLRPTASHDGSLRGQRRNGIAAYTYGAGPGWALIGAVRRFREPPLVIGGLNHLLGWWLAALQRLPRADRPQRSFVRAEQRRRLREELARLWPGRG